MNKKAVISMKKITIMALMIIAIGCNGNKIIFPKQIEFSTSARLVVNEFIPYIEANGYVVINKLDTQMTMMSQNGFMTVEYLETDWKRSGIFHENTGNEYIIKQKVWVTIDMPGVITVESVFGYIDGDEIVVIKNAPGNLYNEVTALPEGLNNLVSSKSL